MLFGAGLAMTVSPHFGFVTAFCIILSVLYSHPRTRWKSLPGLDLAVNMVGYGAGTTLAGILAGTAAHAGIAAANFHLDAASWLLVAAFGLLFGSFYPMTQIYQIEDDRKRGDQTLASALGTRRSLLLSLILALGANQFLLMASLQWLDGVSGMSLGLLILVMCAWLGLILNWYLRAPNMSARDHERGMYWALALWTLFDLAILLCRYSNHLFGSS
jgi:1,4-dihydroxy-2-naphthoate octaprenyltransferase